MAERRPADDHATAGGIGGLERQVRMAAGDQLEVQRRLHAVDLLDQPRAHTLDVDPAHRREGSPATAGSRFRRVRTIRCDRGAAGRSPSRRPLPRARHRRRARSRPRPYDMKQFVARSIGYFWSFPHSQLYAEPVRLAAAGLLTEEVEQGGRKRRTYRLARTGRKALERWLAEPDGRADRDPRPGPAQAVLRQPDAARRSGGPWPRSSAGPTTGGGRSTRPCGTR